MSYPENNGIRIQIVAKSSLPHTPLATSATPASCKLQGRMQVCMMLLHMGLQMLAGKSLHTFVTCDDDIAAAT